MPQSLVQVYVHIVFSTKNRYPFLRDPAARHSVFSYLGGICNNKECPIITIGGVADHVHLLCGMGRTVAIADLIRDLKRDSSKWIKGEHPGLHDFQWQLGYGAFSASPSHVPALLKYIANQEEHHRKVSFQDEFRRLCAKYGLKIDERYVWD